MTINQTPIMFALNNGATLPLRPMKSEKTGNVYWAIAKRNAKGEYVNPGRFGVNVEPQVVGGSLPKSGVLTVGGKSHTFSAVRGTSEIAKRPKVTFSGKVNVGGRDMSFSLTISEGEKSYNVRGAFNGASTGAKALTSL